MTPGSMTARARGLLAGGALALTLPAALDAAELLNGTAHDAAGNALVFKLEGNSREDIVGGQLQVGPARFEIDRVSRNGLIGARRQFDGGAEFVVFSSSFSNETATGTPWAAADSYAGCDAAYNSFLVIYRVTLGAASDQLDEVPYGVLTETTEGSDAANGYCFITRPPG